MFGINVAIHFVSLNRLVSIHLLIHLSSHLFHHHSQHPLLTHSFTPGSKRTFSSDPSHLNKLLVHAGLPSRIIGLYRTYHAHQFVISPYSVAFGVILSLSLLFFCLHG